MLNRIAKLQAVASHLYAQRITGLTPPGPTPHMPAAETEFFKGRISKSTQYVEFGSGGSTVFASALGVPTISVESDRFYAKAVASQLVGSSVSQIVSELGLSGTWGMPVFPRAHLARQYITAPWKYNVFPDFILVDGRYRVGCSLEAARQAFNVGLKSVLMFDDYFERPAYFWIEKYLGSPERIGRAAIFSIGDKPVASDALERSMLEPL